ncbi:hypothetical protein AAX06_08085 [Moraxella bovoculi]|uniref:Uncharacterized protein n=1 Tax=Moraxella bovoculi TaxID=386891 RepID=A0AAC8PW53_9GAMM|nr:hypothetical protein [Moraxella bovoculi]AKG08110.1 hypothetical protein AAX06_08085 [Moraxella bovoculi]AKG11168.1 hypothetical protein AAX07_03190 [Moraxella bovoculi]
MKKILKIVAIIFALIFGIGLIGLVLETPEQKAEREAKALQEKQNQSTKIENDAEQAKIIESKEEGAEVAQTFEIDGKSDIQANFGMTPQELGAKIDKKTSDELGAKTKLATVQTTGNSFIFDLGEGVFWTGNVDEHGMVSASSYRMTVKKGDDKDRITAMLLLVGLTAQILHPDKDSEEIGKIAKMASSATTKALQTSDAVNDSILIDDIKHYVEIYPSTGSITIGAYYKDQ